MKLNNFIRGSVLLTTILIAHSVSASIALDRTRVIVNGSESSTTLHINNKNPKLPYLAQGWIEDPQGKKIQGPLVVLPPVQRLEPGKSSQLKVQALPAATQQLPQDRETLYYFNLREIPPKSDKSNSLQIALQTRIKLFYRPQGIVPDKNKPAAPWQEQLILERQGNGYHVNNPTAYYITLVDVGSKKGDSVTGFEPVMVAPFSKADLKVKASTLGNTPVLTYINDHGGRPQLNFSCNAGSCRTAANAKS